jgi:hypothetical protein
VSTLARAITALSASSDMSWKIRSPRNMTSTASASAAAMLDPMAPME